jgi:SET domain-containing protein
MGPSGEVDNFFNHSCDPNAGLKITATKAVLVAIKDISLGQEITWDYSTTMDEDDWEMNGNCGSNNCSGKIRDFKYLPPEIQQKYLTLDIVQSIL